MLYEVITNTNALTPPGSISQSDVGTYEFQVSNNGQATAVINSLDDINVFVDGGDISLNPGYQIALASGQSSYNFV